MEISLEEKKALEYFYNLRATIDASNMLFDEDVNVKCGKETIIQITIILNLINKLQKENEKLKEKNLIQEAMIKDSISKETIKKFFIEKKKIKDKIEELRAEYKYLGEENKRVNKFEIELLQELIEGD